MTEERPHKLSNEFNNINWIIPKRLFPYGSLSF